MTVNKKGYLTSLNLSKRQKNLVAKLLDEQRLYYTGNCPICNTYLSPPFDGWCSVCKKQTIGEKPTRYGEIESMAYATITGIELTSEEFRDRVGK